ncbi:disease resistance protein RPM1-like [Magnolia sinica]|uniref:disease resistance protein RPM1-like n=1 Tax=Magnolia sinica TaxID=86752 RepID=UPI00265912D2|nr:disease resistance protein RPM1-like [Magnolia sinica]
MQEVAEGYLNALIARNLVQVAERKSYGKLITCHIHDLVPEIIISKSREEHFFASSVEQNKILVIESGVCLFTTMVVDLENVSMDSFPDSLTSLYHLRYLSLENTKMKKLPNSLGKLKNLETLNLKGTFVCELPIEILKLQNLRHLLIYRYARKGVYLPFNAVDGIKVPTGMGSMRSLQKLAYIEAESSVVRELGNLIELRKFGVIKLRTEDGDDLCTSVEKMNHLQAFSARLMDAEELLDLHSLSYPPPTLQRLCLSGRLLKLPQWIASLDNLVSVRLRWSRLRDDPLKALQSLPNLVELFLERAYNGEELCCEAGGYPRLKDLSLLDLKELKKVRIENGAMYCLEKLRMVVKS